jgi:hypothetical protein
MFPDPSLTAAASSVLVGFVLPLLVALLTRPSASTNVKQAVQFVLAILAGAGVTIGTQPDADTITAALGVVITYTSSQANYHELWKNLSWFPWLQNALVSDPLHTEVDDADDADDGRASKDI